MEDLVLIIVKPVMKQIIERLQILLLVNAYAMKAILIQAHLHALTVITLGFQRIYYLY